MGAARDARAHNHRRGHKEPASGPVPVDGTWRADEAHGLVGGRLVDGVLSLPGRGVFYANAAD